MTHFTRLNFDPFDFPPFEVRLRIRYTLDLICPNRLILLLIV
jgi:hypothetical protein